MFDTQQSIAAQDEYCYTHSVPCFAPIRSGNCYRCGRDIYKQITWSDGHASGIGVKEAGSGHVTGCPHCNYSFCN